MGTETFLELPVGVFAVALVENGESGFVYGFEVSVDGADRNAKTRRYLGSRQPPLVRFQYLEDLPLTGYLITAHPSPLHQHRRIEK